MGISSCYCSKLQVTTPAAEMGLDDLTCFSAATAHSPAVGVHCNELVNGAHRDTVGCEPQWLTQLTLLLHSRNGSRQVRHVVSVKMCPATAKSGKAAPARAQQGLAGQSLSQRQSLICAIILLSDSNQECKCKKEN